MQIRFMVSRPMQIDDSTNDGVDDDDLDLVDGAAAGQGVGQAAGAADNAAGLSKGDSAAPAKKSVRLAADGEGCCMRVGFASLAVAHGPVLGLHRGHT